MGIVMKEKKNYFYNIPDRIKRLNDLAYNIWFSWNSNAIDLFLMLDKKLWDYTGHNPVRFLHEIDTQRLYYASKEKAFIEQYDRVVTAFDRYMTDKQTWFDKNYPQYNEKLIAYFCMEFGLHKCIPIYSGGLGILAGDHLKTASDMGIPIVGVGLLYRMSYFTQYITRQGDQQAAYLSNDFSNMALQLVKQNDGSNLTIRIDLGQRTVAARIWKVQVGRVPLFLLDTDFPENAHEDRKITERLYVEDRDCRLIQEMLIGIGGLSALNAMGIYPSVWHMNEGHSGFLGLARFNQMLKNGVVLDQIHERIRSSTVFTTHTPVPAGNEVFKKVHVNRFFRTLWESMGLSREQFYHLCQGENAHDSKDLNMTVLAFRMADHANAVSRIHGDVARRMWSELWPSNSAKEVPIGFITNGVHPFTWMTTQVEQLFDEFIGKHWREKLTERAFWDCVEKIPDDRLWNVRQELKTLFIGEVRERLLKHRERNGESKSSINAIEKVLDPNILTIGFARRFAPYKRAGLIFEDPQRLQKIVTNDDFPVQIIFAGKAHPADEQGKKLIKMIYKNSRSPKYAGRIVFVENYDMTLALRMVSGVDIWLNTPQRQLEASGTSGMKAAVNGGLNLSILDGWWGEGYNGQNGWAIGESVESNNEFSQDDEDSKSLYQILEDRIIPMYYQRDDLCLPRQWIKKIKMSMKSLIPCFNTFRMLEEYVQMMYIPAARNYEK